MKLISPIAIVLDTSPLGLLTQRPGHAAGDICKAWAAGLNRAGCRFFVPEIADYELRRELLRHSNLAAIARLEAFSAGVSGSYLPLTTLEVRLAAAQADLLDFAALGLTGVVVATANAGHLSVLTSAALWSDIGY